VGEAVLEENVDSLRERGSDHNFYHCTRRWQLGDGNTSPHRIGLAEEPFVNLVNRRFVFERRQVDLDKRNILNICSSSFERRLKISKLDFGLLLCVTVFDRSVLANWNMY